MGEPITGKDGDVQVGGVDVAHVRRFSISRSADNKSYKSSDTNGWTKTAEGNKLWTITIDVYAEGGTLVLGFDEGDLIEFKGITTAGKYIEGNVRVDSIEDEVQIEEAELVTATINGTGDGPYVPTG